MFLIDSFVLRLALLFCWMLVHSISGLDIHCWFLLGKPSFYNVFVVAAQVSVDVVLEVMAVVAPPPSSKKPYLGVFFSWNSF